MPTTIIPSKPVFTARTAKECQQLLARDHIGRLAYLNAGQVDIEPVHYAASNSWIFVRSAEGTKLEAFAHTPYCAFEVDEVDAPFDWRSVVAHGTIYMMSEHGVRAERVDFRPCLAQFARLYPRDVRCW